MNKNKTVFAVTAAALMAAHGTSFGADLMPGQAPYLSAPAYSWMGPYVGLNLGYQWADASNTGASPNGFVGGLQGGYNWQMGQFVAGAEADLQASGANDTFAAWKFSNPWFGTLRGRAGYAMNNVLLYATMGLAYGGGKVEMGSFSESNTHVGWTAGAGIEVGLTPNWSAKAEYLYVDLSNQGYTLFGNNVGFESNILRFGVNYRF